MLRLTFLGTGTSQGVPMIGCQCEVCRSKDNRDKRLRSSAMVEKVDGSGNVTTRIIIDAGPDFRFQMLREGISSIDGILLTHEHKDHLAGLDDVRAFNYFQNRATDIYATERVANVLKKDFDYAFSDHKYPGAPDIDLHIIDPQQPFRVGELDIIPIEGLHYRLPVTGFRIGKLAYLTDFNDMGSESIEKLKGVDTLIVNALRFEKHISHYTVEEAVELSKKIGPRQTYLTHMSHQIGLHERVDELLPQGVQPGHDGMRIEIDD